MSSLMSLPAISSSAQSAISKKPKEDDNSKAINAMCKTLNATITNLLYSFAALNSESSAGKDGMSSSITAALAASKRDELSNKIAEALAGSVERVIKCKDASLRSMAIREVRARFAVVEKPKPEMCDQGVQAAPRRPKVSLVSAANAVMSHDSPAQVAFLGSFRKSPKDSKAAAAAPALSDEEILKQLSAPPQLASDDAPVTTTVTTSTATDGASALKDLAGADGRLNTNSGRPSSGSSASAAAPAAAASGEAAAAKAAVAAKAAPANGMYERQMKWAAKAAEKREKMLVEKENKEREAEKAPDGASKRSQKWAHVESVMKRERIASEEGWKLDMQAEMQEEREARREAERKAREEAAARAKLVAERDRSEELRKEAIQKMDTAHARMVAAEGKYEKAKKAQEQLEAQHAEELEIRGAFGEKGLEVWPMFPGRKVHRVLDSDTFDGRVSQEFRVKDAESGERGVTLLMGRLAHAKAAEAQAVLFDAKYMSDLEAARWFSANAHRFEQVKERISREKQRAQSAQPSTRAEAARSAAGKGEFMTDAALLKFPGLKPR